MNTVRPPTCTSEVTVVWRYINSVIIIIIIIIINMHNDFDSVLTMN